MAVGGVEEDFLHQQMARSKQAAGTKMKRVGVYADPVSLSAFFAPGPRSVELDVSDNGSVGLKLEDLVREGEVV